MKKKSRSNAHFVVGLSGPVVRECAAFAKGRRELNSRCTSRAIVKAAAGRLDACPINCCAGLPEAGPVYGFTTAPTKMVR